MKWSGWIGLLPILVGVWLLVGCEFSEPDLSNFGKFRLTKLQGQHVEAEFNVDCENKNGIGFKMKKADIDVLVDDQLLGKITMNKKIKVPRKSKNTYTVPLVIELEKGTLLKLLQLSMRKEVTVHFKGKIRGSVCGISKSFKVDETKSIDGKLFNMGDAE